MAIIAMTYLLVQKTKNKQISTSMLQL